MAELKQIPPVTISAPAQPGVVETDPKKALAEIIRRRIIDGGLPHETAAELIARKTKGGATEDQVLHEPSVLRSMADGVMSVTGNTTKNEQEARTLRVEVASYYDAFLKDHHIIDKLDPKQIQDLIDPNKPEALAQMLATGQLPKPNADDKAATAVTAIPMTVQDTAQDVLSDKLKLVGNVDVVSNIAQFALSEIKGLFYKDPPKDELANTAFNRFRDGYLDGIRDELKTKSPYSAEQQEEVIQKLKEQLASPAAFEKSAVDTFANALPVPKDNEGKPLTDDPIRLKMQAGIDETVKRGMEKGATAEDKIFSIYSRHNPQQNLIDDPSIKMTGLFNAIGAEYKLSREQTELLKITGEAAMKAGGSRQNMEAAAQSSLIKYATEKYGPLPAPMSVLKASEKNPAVMLHYTLKATGATLPYGLTPEKLMALRRKDPKAMEEFKNQHGMEAFFKHIFDPSTAGGLEQKIAAGVERDIRSNPAIRMAEAMRNNPTLAALKRAGDFLQGHNPAVDLLKKLGQGNTGEMKFANGEYNFGPTMVQKFVEGARANVIKGNNGTLPAGAESILQELARKTPTELAALTEPDMARKFTVAGISEQLGYTKPHVQQSVPPNNDHPQVIVAKGETRPAAVKAERPAAVPPQPVDGRRRYQHVHHAGDGPATPAAAHDRHEHANHHASTERRRRRERIHHHDAHPVEQKQHTNKHHKQHKPLHNGNEFPDMIARFFRHNSP